MMRGRFDIPWHQTTVGKVEAGGASCQTLREMSLVRSPAVVAEAASRFFVVGPVRSIL